MPVAAGTFSLPLTVIISLTANQHFEDLNLAPLFFVGVMLYLAFGAVVGMIAAVFIRNAQYGISALIGIGATVGGGLVFSGFFAIAYYISLHISFSERIDFALGVVANAILLAIILATFVIIVVLIRRVGRSVPE